MSKKVVLITKRDLSSAIDMCSPSVLDGVGNALFQKFWGALEAKDQQARPEPWTGFEISKAHICCRFCGFQRGKHREPDGACPVRKPKPTSPRWNEKSLYAAKKPRVYK